MPESLDKLKSELLARLVRGELTKAEYQELLAEVERQHLARPAQGIASLPTSMAPESRPDLPTTFRTELSPPQALYDPVSDPGGATRFGPVGAPELRPGLKVGKFELREFLGKGGMGQCWKAWDPSEQNLVVLKFLPSEMRRSEEDVGRFQETYRRVRRLHHTHICPLYDLGEDHLFGAFQVMLFLEGINLSKWRMKHMDANGRLSLSQIERVLRPVALALDYAHKEGVIHRDVKPGNIVVRESPWDVHIIDFGLAAELQTALSRTSRVQMEASGTEAYMAPEQWQGKFQDHQTDQYALAVMAYELLTGHLPFTAPNSMALAFAVTTSDPDPISGLSDSLNAAVLKALSRQRKDRFSTCVEFLDALIRPQQIPVAPLPKVLPPAVAPSLVARSRPSLLQAPFGPSEIKVAREAWSKYLDQPIEITNSIGMKLVLIPPGEFLMGASDGEIDAHYSERPPHRVQITQPFYAGAFPITQQEWQTVTETNPSYFKGERRPVEQVTWHEVRAFAHSLSLRAEEKTLGRTYRLPTEAEWEYFCRAGTETPFWFGSVLNGQLANVNGNYPYGTSEKGPYLNETSEVGKYAANLFGLFDVHGNVDQWCQDWYQASYYSYYRSSPVVDPAGASSGEYRVYRGSSWNSVGISSRSFVRGWDTPNVRYAYLGGRIVSSALGQDFSSVTPSVMGLAPIA